MKYGVISDIHNHAHSIFSTVDSDGVNSRLRITLNETERAAAAVKAAGGSRLVIAGDIFHTRGIMDPEVLNPVRDSFARILDSGVNILAIPGNHDLKSRDTVEISSAIQNLEMIGMSGAVMRIINEPVILPYLSHNLGFVPWRSDIDALLADLKKLATSGQDPAITDVFIHAGIDDVLTNCPPGGLNDTILGAFGFRRVFAGHYHNHKVLRHNVVSIGATAHHNWGDVGTRAGFLLVDDETGAIDFHDTRAPKFVDLSGLDADEMEMECRGNYVRFRGPPMTQSEISDLREVFRAWGAKGVSIEVPRVAVSARATAPAKGLTIKESIDAFVTGMTLPSNVKAEDVVKRSQEIFDLSQSVVEES